MPSIALEALHREARVGRIPPVTSATFQVRLGLALLGLAMLGGSGCASMRCRASDPYHRPCAEGFALTDDGWKLGIRRVRPLHPDAGKLPIVLCHGLGLNGTFWTITDDHLPAQLAANGYEVFICDLRGSGASQKIGMVGKVNSLLRQTPLLEVGESAWSVDDLVKHDVPAILNYVKSETGCDRVNWVGHSLGGMLMFAYLEVSPDSWRIANFVGMGSTIVQKDYPQTQMLRANRGIRNLLKVVSTGRIARPMMWYRPSPLAMVDRFYYTAANVDKRTVDRFYGYTLENPGRGALQQLDPYLEHGDFVSADGHMNYAKNLSRVGTPLLMVAGEGDVMSDIASTQLTYNAVASTDKTLMRVGKINGQADDYGHCDLVWSRFAPVEIFPSLIEWLDRRQPGVTALWPVRPSPQQR
jgi:lysosomal acid lipase/cholesteryl ester hydrolase